jgi:hypothetical protein
MYSPDHLVLSLRILSTHQVFIKATQEAHTFSVENLLNSLYRIATAQTKNLTRLKLKQAL